MISYGESFHGFTFCRWLYQRAGDTALIRGRLERRDGGTGVLGDNEGIGAASRSHAWTAAAAIAHASATSIGDNAAAASFQHTVDVFQMFGSITWKKHTQI